MISQGATYKYMSQWLSRWMITQRPSATITGHLKSSHGKVVSILVHLERGMALIAFAGWDAPWTDHFLVDVFALFASPFTTSQNTKAGGCEGFYLESGEGYKRDPSCNI